MYLFFTPIHGPFVKYSFDTLLKLREVTYFDGLVMMFVDRAGAEIPGSEAQAGFRYGTVGSSVFRGGR